jgi:hypothetical protein
MSRGAAAAQARGAGYRLRMAARGRGPLIAWP